MAEGNDEGTPGPKVSAAAPRPKPPVPSSPGPKRPPPPPPIEANPFLPPESSSKIDAEWLVLEDAPPSTDAPAPPPPATPTVAKPETTIDAEAAPESSPFKKRSRGKVLAFVLLPVLVLAGGGVAYQSQMAARPAPPPPQTAEPTAEPAPTHEPAPPPTHTAEPPPSASAVEKKPAMGAGAPAAAVSIDPASRATLDGTALPPGRKIIVDGRVVGTSPRSVQVRCGTHTVQIGDQPPESIAFPCGGEVSFTE